MRLSIRQLFALALAFALLLAFLPFAINLYTYATNAFADLAGKIEFENLSGWQAKSRLHSWPKSIATEDIKLISCKHDYSRFVFDMVPCRIVA